MQWLFYSCSEFMMSSFSLLVCTHNHPEAELSAVFDTMAWVVSGGWMITGQTGWLLLFMLKMMPKWLITQAAKERKWERKKERKKNSHAKGFRRLNMCKGLKGGASRLIKWAKEGIECIIHDIYNRQIQIWSSIFHFMCKKKTKNPKPVSLYTYKDMTPQPGE